MSQHVHIVYASRFGQTRTIARRLADAATTAGHVVSLTQVTTEPHELPDEATFVLVAGAVYSNQHDEQLQRYLRTHAEALARRRTALLSVSLAKALATDVGEDMALDYIDELTELTGFEPGDVAMVAGASNDSAYDPATRALLNVATWRRGLTGGPDAEYTDWAAVDALAARWFS